MKKILFTLAAAITMMCATTVNASAAQVTEPASIQASTNASTVVIIIISDDGTTIIIID